MLGKIKVAIINTSVEITNMLENVLADSGFETVSAFTYEFKENSSNFDEFIKINKPAVIVYDVAIPYDENYLLMTRLMSKKTISKIPFVVTTTNKKALESMVGNTMAFELIGKPYDLDEIIAAVKRAAIKVTPTLTS